MSNSNLFSEAHAAAYSSLNQLHFCNVQLNSVIKEEYVLHSLTKHQMHLLKNSIMETKELLLKEEKVAPHIKKEMLEKIDTVVGMISDKQLQHIAGLEAYTRNELKDLINYFIECQLNWTRKDFHVKSMAITSIRGTRIEVSFEYNGRYKDIEIGRSLNLQSLSIEGVTIDFSPYARYTGERLIQKSSDINLI
jgi:formate dehydrogenase maturation protein FdhE